MALVDLEEAEIALALPRDADALDLIGVQAGKLRDHGVLGHAGVDHLAQKPRPEFQRGVPQRRVTRLDEKFLALSANDGIPKMVPSSALRWCRSRRRLRQRCGPC